MIDFTKDFLVRFFPLFLQGLKMTLEVWVFSAALSGFLGITFGILTCDRLKNVFTTFIEIITFVLRAVPFFVQLLIVYFVLPDLIGCNLEPFPASVIALGLCSSGYVTQIVRAGINSIPSAQWECADTLGYSTFEILWYVILPQMVRNVLPAFNNELDSLLKSTSIVASIGMLELTRVGMNIVSREMQPVPVYLTIACFYIVMSACLNVVTRFLERKLCYAKA
ncbi:MAG: amino acid ABC transporter permease [Chlamydiae bacterium]|nr:amino acid ABC transporter permease [Chlamydiota bacterium]